MIDSPPNPSDSLERVDTLTNALLDQVITEEEIRELGEMLADEAPARTRYIEYMQLHVDLIEHYNADRKKPITVLGMLGENDLTSDTPVVAPPAKES